VIPGITDDPTPISVLLPTVTLPHRLTPGAICVKLPILQS